MCCASWVSLEIKYRNKATVMSMGCDCACRKQSFKLCEITCMSQNFMRKMGEHSNHVRGTN